MHLLMEQGVVSSNLTTPTTLRYNAYEYSNIHCFVDSIFPTFTPQVSNCFISAKDDWFLSSGKKATLI